MILLKILEIQIKNRSLLLVPEYDYGAESSCWSKAGNYQRKVRIKSNLYL